MRDSIVALLTLDAQSRGLISKGLNTSLWETYMQDEKNLYDSMWLLTYEANIKGWLTPTIDPIAKDKNFEFLRQHKVEFYDPRRVKQVTINDIWSSQLNVPLFSF